MIDDLEARFEANVAVAHETLRAALADPWVKGSTGQKVAHPGFSVAAKCDEVALRLAAEVRAARRGVPDAGPSGFEELDAIDEIAAAGTGSFAMETRRDLSPAFPWPVSQAQAVFLPGRRVRRAGVGGLGVCELHHARLAEVAAELKKWGPKPRELPRRRTTWTTPN